MTLLIVNDSAENCPETYLNDWIGKLSGELLKRSLITPEQNGKELSVVFLDEKDAKRINWQYRSKDYATDVLSFETDDPDGFGELIMCPQILKKQAQENKLSYENEVSRMIVHGVLHLLGHNHEVSPEEEKRVLNLQENIILSLNPPAEKKLRLIKGGTTVAEKPKAAVKSKAATGNLKASPKAKAAAASAKKDKPKKVLTQKKKHGKKK